jgi:antitoxin (DNA-binding transcriptional repressor) of toxin-antitoxin stability system
MSTVTLDQARRQLSELVLSLPIEGEVLILGANGPVAKLSPVASATNRTSLRQLEPRSVGALLRPYPAAADDLLDEMLPSSR